MRAWWRRRQWRWWLGCAFRFVFRFLTGLIFRNPRNSADDFRFRGTHVGIKSFQGKINLFRNPTESRIPQQAVGTSGASSSSSASFPPRRDGGAPREIPSDGGGSDVSRIVREFGISKIRASTVVVVDPLTSPPSSPSSGAWRALLAAVAPTAKQLRLQR